MAPHRNKKIKYSSENLIEAIAEIKASKLSVRQASEKYGIPKTTLGDRASGRRPFSIKNRGEHLVYLI